MQFILTDYIEVAMSHAAYDKLKDGTFVGRVVSCPGVVALSETLWECQRELRSTLEGWILLGLKLGHPLPVLEGIDLSGPPVHEPMGAESPGETPGERPGVQHPRQRRALSL